MRHTRAAYVAGCSHSSFATGSAASITGLHVRSVTHRTLGSSLVGPWPGCRHAHFSMGPFCRAEEAFASVRGVVCTVAGYCGGDLEHPTHREVVTGQSGHLEAVKVVYDPDVTCYGSLLQTFFASHDSASPAVAGVPGRQLGSVVWAAGERQRAAAEWMLASFADRLRPISVRTSVGDAGPFYPADVPFQQIRLLRPPHQSEFRSSDAVLPSRGFISRAAPKCGGAVLRRLREAARSPPLSAGLPASVSEELATDDEWA